MRSHFFEVNEPGDPRVARAERIEIALNQYMAEVRTLRTLLVSTMRSSARVTLVPIALMGVLRE